MNLLLRNDDSGSQSYTFSYANTLTGPYQQLGSTISGVGPSTGTLWNPVPLSTGTLCTGSIPSGNSVFLRLSGTGSGLDKIAVQSISITPGTTPACTLSSYSNYQSANVKSSSVDLSWASNGSGICTDQYLIIAREGAMPATDITEVNLEGLYDESSFTGTSDWSARNSTNEVFESTSNNLGGDNIDYVVFNGTATSTSITGLDGDTEYNFSLWVVGDICVWKNIGDITISTLLPIELAFFEGTAEEDYIQLNWMTISELNNDYMAVERSIDREVFEEIGRIPGRGTTLNSQSYLFIDDQPYSGTNYYRLRQVDFDGTLTYHRIIAVDYKGKSMELLLFPSITSEALTLRWSTEKAAPAEIRIYDQIGKLISHQFVKGEDSNLRLSVENLNPGHYYLQVRSVHGVRTERFIKQ